MNTLKFASRAKTIKNKAKANVQRSPAEYMRIIKQLKEEVESLKLRIKKMKTKKAGTVSPVLLSPAISNTEPDASQSVASPAITDISDLGSVGVTETDEPHPLKYKKSVTFPDEIIDDREQASIQR